MVKKIIFLCSLISLFFHASSQSQSAIPNVIPPSPTSVQFQRYGDYPVNNFTGLPTINIPIYTIKEGDIEVPVYLSYHASGTRVDDVSGFVGLGWTLNTGGMISRTINGLPDEQYAFKIPAQKAGQIPLSEIGAFNELKDLERGIYDHEYDVYSYNFLGKSGKYINTGTSNGQPFFIQACNLKFVNDGIADENGIVYSFGGAIEYQDYSDLNSERTAPSTWHLSTITSAKDHSNVVSYSYQPGHNYAFNKPVTQYILDDWWNYNWDYNCSDFPYSECNNGSGLSQSAYLMKYITYVPKEINFASGKIKFNQDPSTKMLTSIEIINKSNLLIKKVEFVIVPFPSNMSYSPNPFSSYKLQSLTFKDRINSNVETYTFNYNNENDADAKPLAYSTSGKDHWGFYNGDGGRDNNLLSLPNFLTRDDNRLHTKTIGGKSIKSPDESYSKVYTLNKITYPTGGYTIFDLEGNKKQHDIPVGGLRIKSISNYTGNNQLAYQKKYSYSGPHTEITPLDEMYIHNMLGYYWTDNIRRTYMSENVGIDFAPQGSPVVYTLVSEADGNSSIEYQYDNGNAYTYEDLSFPGTSIVPFNTPPQLFFKKLSNYYKPWNFGNLISKTIHGASGIQTEENDYEEFVKDTARDFIITRWIFAECSPRRPDCAVRTGFEWEVHADGGSVFNFADRFHLSGGKRLKKTTTKYSSGNETIITFKNYYYDNPEKPTVATRITTTNSKGELITTYLKYPFDYPNTSPYNEMVERNVISPVIEQTQINTSLNKELNKSRTNYSLWHNNSILQPVSFEGSVFGNPLRTEATINQYDAKGNILQMTGKNGIVTSYLWGYNKAYPVAQVTGCDYSTASSFINQSILDNPSSEEVLRNELNKIRTGIAEAKAMVTTFTYTPLIGMTSTTDGNKRTTYYEYDVAGRLQHIRDENQNILRKFSYAYQDESENAGISRTPLWQPTGNTRLEPCPADNNFTTGVLQRQEKDENPNSAVYGKNRWVNVSEGNFPESDWQNTNNYRCVEEYSQLTGVQEREQVNINPCRSGETRWVVVPNSTACPRPPFFTSIDFSGYYYSTQCAIPAEEPEPVYISVPAGMFTDSVSVTNANRKAEEYAHQQADQQNSCKVLPVTLKFYNCSPDNIVDIDIYLTNVATTEQHFYSPRFSKDLEQIPPGIYNITIILGDSKNAYFRIGDFYDYGNRTEISNITLDYSSNTISVCDYQ